MNFINDNNTIKSQTNVDSSIQIRPKRTLKSMIIDPFKQVRIGIYVLMVTIIFLFLSGYLFVHSFFKQYENVMEIFNVTDMSTKWALITNDIFYANIIKLIVLFIIFIVVLFFIIFKMTHKIYGPLISIERFVKAISDGEYNKRIVIRKGDDLQRLVISLNHMAQELEKRHGFKDRRKSNTEIQN